MHISAPTYQRSFFESRRDNEDFRLFLAEVLTVDVDAKRCTLRDIHSGLPYQNVKLIPANHSSPQSTDVFMPEDGSRCLCAKIASDAGFSEIAIITWVVSDTLRARMGIAVTSVDQQGMEGWSNRLRGNFRKPYSGQRTVTNSHGYSERQDDGWDRQAADLSRESMDPDARTWSRTTSREVTYNDASTAFSGPVTRQGAPGLGNELLPDGSTRQIAYLAPGAVASDRYIKGKQDVIAFTERTTKVQEFALDHAVPLEVIGTSFLDGVLGVAADPWGRTTVSAVGGLLFDDQSHPITQASDMPYTAPQTQAVGPTTQDAPTPRRRGYIIERTEGTLVGSCLFDPTTYGQVLKPVLFPYTKLGRFATDVQSSYLPVVDSPSHVEARLAASAHSTRFTHEGNTTRWDVTKEGMVSFELGATLPKENIGYAGSTYEHPHGAGRSLEAHMVGSMKMVVGKNRDEEEAFDFTALGQTVLRLGSDDSSLPNQRRDVETQMRGQNDQVAPRTLQYWTKPKAAQGDAGSLTNKTGMENISLRGAFDGGTVLRLGARNQNSLRRHLMNGYQDGPGVNPWAVTDGKRQDSKTSGRPAYAQGDATYAFHDLTQAGKSKLNLLPYIWSGSPVTNMDRHGLSLDVHAVRDVLLRIGKNTDSGQSLLMDLAGGLVAAFGKDNAGRSVTATLDGGAEVTIGPSASGKALRIEFNGDVDWIVNGNFNLHVTGDTTFESTVHQHIVKTDVIVKAQKQTYMALAHITHEAPDLIQNQGAYASGPNDAPASIA